MSKYAYTTLFAALSVLNRSSKTAAKLRGERRGEEVGKHEIDVEFLTDLWEKQKGLCSALSRNQSRVMVEIGKHIKKMT
jgi:hypothetical protein